MKILRPVAATLALTVSFAFSAHSNAADASATDASNQVAHHAESTVNLAKVYEQIRSDVTKAEFSGKEMLGRIDSLVSRIDSQMKVSNENSTDLTNLRNATLQMRSQVVEFISGNGTSLVQVLDPMAPASSIMPGISGDFLLEQPVTQGSFGGPGMNGGSMGGGGGGGYSGGSGGGGGGLGGGLGGLGSLAGIGAVAAASDDDAAGPIASVSTP